MNIFLNHQIDMIDVQYFGIFDGHAGAGAALMAADQLINHLQACRLGIDEEFKTMTTQLD